VFTQTVVISNSTCDVVCGTIYSHHSTTGSFQRQPLFPKGNDINFGLKHYKLQTQEENITKKIDSRAVNFAVFV